MSRGSGCAVRLTSGVQLQTGARIPTGGQPPCPPVCQLQRLVRRPANHADPQHRISVAGGETEGTVRQMNRARQPYPSLPCTAPSRPPSDLASATSQSQVPSEESGDAISETAEREVPLRCLVELEEAAATVRARGAKAAALAARMVTAPKATTGTESASRVRASSKSLTSSSAAGV